VHEAVAAGEVLEDLSGRESGIDEYLGGFCAKRLVDFNDSEA
jgi:hypothetical protein